MTWGCFLTLIQSHLMKVKMTDRKGAKFVSGLYLFIEKHKKFLIHTSSTYDFKMCHDLGPRSFGQILGHCLKYLPPVCVMSCINENNFNSKFDTKLACIRWNKSIVRFPSLPCGKGPPSYISSFFGKKKFLGKIGLGKQKTQNIYWLLDMWIIVWFQSCLLS